MPRVTYVLVHEKRSGSVLDVTVDMEGFWARGWDDEMQLDTPRAMVVMKTSFASWNSDEIRLERVRPPASSVEDGGVVCLHGKIGRGHQRPRKGDGKTEGKNPQRSFTKLAGSRRTRRRPSRSPARKLGSLGAL